MTLFPLLACLLLSATRAETPDPLALREDGIHYQSFSFPGVGREIWKHILESPAGACAPKTEADGYEKYWNALPAEKRLACLEEAQRWSVQQAPRRRAVMLWQARGNPAVAAKFGDQDLETVRSWMGQRFYDELAKARAAAGGKAGTAGSLAKTGEMVSKIQAPFDSKTPATTLSFNAPAAPPGPGHKLFTVNAAGDNALEIGQPQSQSKLIVSAGGGKSSLMLDVPGVKIAAAGGPGRTQTAVHASWQECVSSLAVAAMDRIDKMEDSVAKTAASATAFAFKLIAPGQAAEIEKKVGPAKVEAHGSAASAEMGVGVSFDRGSLHAQAGVEKKLSQPAQVAVNVNTKAGNLSAQASGAQHGTLSGSYNVTPGQIKSVFTRKKNPDQ
jgi:hypothetical protein